MQIFKLIILFWVTTRIGLHTKNKSFLILSDAAALYSPSTVISQLALMITEQLS